MNIKNFNNSQVSCLKTELCVCFIDQKTFWIIDNKKIILIVIPHLTICTDISIHIMNNRSWKKIVFDA